jgi:hypothetical protein
MKRTTRVANYLLYLSLLMSTAVTFANECSDRLSSVFEAQDFAIASRDMLIIVRRQAQDFKNVLLRNGTKSVDTMRSRLKQREEEFQVQLASLDTWSTKTSHYRDVVALVKAEGAKVAQAYSDAIASLDSLDRLTSFKADEIAQGVDVPIFRHLEGLIKQTSDDLSKTQALVVLACTKSIGQ